MDVLLAEQPAAQNFPGRPWKIKFSPEASNYFSQPGIYKLMHIAAFFKQFGVYMS